MRGSGLRAYRANDGLYSRCMMYELKLVPYKPSASVLVAMETGAEAWRI
jgi:hypothetical protein